MSNPNNIDLTNDTEVYSCGWGLIFCVWCAPSKFTAEEVQAAVNAKDRPGTSANEWVISEPDDEREGDFKGVNHLPCPGDVNRTHWLVNC